MPSATPVENPRVELKDLATKAARIRLATAGEGAATPVVLVHDVLQSHLAFSSVVPLLARRGRCFALDLPGAGESEKPSAARFAYSVSALADVVVDLVASMRLGRVAIVGHGVGAAIALACAAAHPAVVTKLVLVAPVVYEGAIGPLDRLARIPLLGPVAIKQLVGFSEFRRYFASYVFADDAAVAVDRIRAHFECFSSPAGREATLATLRATADRRSTVAILPRVRQETLVVAGRLDRLVPLADGRRLARELASARLVALDAGHSPPEEVPEAFAKVVGDFLWHG